MTTGEEFVASEQYDKTYEKVKQDVIDEQDLALGRILRRFLLEDEPSYNSPPYHSFSNERLTLDGKTRLNEGEADLIRSLGEGGN